MGLNKDFVAVDPEFLTEERRQDFRAQLLSNLPTHAEVVYLADLYYAQAVSNAVVSATNSLIHLAGLVVSQQQRDTRPFIKDLSSYNPVPRQRLDKIVSALYSGSDEAIQGVYNQDLSIVYSILAMGELMSDKNLPYSTLQKRHAYHAKLAITVDCVYVVRLVSTSHAAGPSYTLPQHAGVATIEAMLLRALYMLLNDDPGSAQKVWGNLGLITKLAMSVSDIYPQTESSG
jgi:hypothetical protein